MTGSIFHKELILKNKCIKLCDICHYWYFLNRNLKYEPYLSNGFHYLIQEAISLNDVTMISVKGSDYKINICYRCKNDTKHVIKNYNLNEKRGLLWIFIIYKNKRNNLLSKKQRCYSKYSKRSL